MQRVSDLAVGAKWRQLMTTRQQSKKDGRKIMFTGKQISRGGMAVGLVIASLGGVARADGPPVSATVNRIANQKFDEGQAHAIYMTFRNNAATTADLVRFQVRQGRDVVDVSDAGTFSTGTDITHRFANPNASFGTPWQSPSVAVTYVHFTDGSSWVGGDRSQARTR